MNYYLDIEVQAERYEQEQEALQWLKEEEEAMTYAREMTSHALPSDEDFEAMYEEYTRRYA